MKRSAIVVALWLAGCAPDRYWVRPDELASARASHAATVRAVRADDGSPARPFVDELVPPPAPPQPPPPDGARPVLMTAVNGAGIVPAAPPEAGPRFARSRRSLALIIAGTIAVAVGIPLLVVGGIGGANWGGLPPSRCSGLCLDYRPLGWLIFGFGAAFEAVGVPSIAIGATMR